jgi:hypothetical protein
MSQTPTNKNNKRPLQETGYDSDKTEIYETDDDEDDTNKENKRNFLIVDTSQFMNQLKTPEKTKSEFISDPPTVMLSDSGHELFHDENGQNHVTSDTYDPYSSYYELVGKDLKPFVSKIRILYVQMKELVKHDHNV